MKIAICSAVLDELDFAGQCAYAAALGYDGLEVVPALLQADPSTLTESQCSAFRRIAADAGVEITGMHRLMSAAPGLSIVASDPRLHAKTGDFLRRMIDVCAQLGGSVLVHGSPAQRSFDPSQGPADAWARARETFNALADHARECGVVYCVEPLPPDETNFINTLDEATRMVDEVGSANFRTMIDAKSVLLGETESLVAVIDRWLPTARIAHVQVNDRNRRGPGQGEQAFAPVLAALLRNGYRGVVTVEPFVFVPDKQATAARSIGYLRGILEALASQQTVPVNAGMEGQRTQ